MPRRTLSSVVLPHPDEPSMETICPSWMARSISSSTTCAPYAFWMCLNSSMGLPHGFWRRHDHREGIVPRARKRPARRPLRFPMHVKGYGKGGAMSIGAARESIAAARGPIATVRTSIAAAREAPTAARPDQLPRRCASHRRRQRTRRRTARLLHGAHVILVDGDLGHRLGIRLDNQAREALLDL